MPVKFVGILNCTPDSFSDGGRYFTPLSARDHLQRLVDTGAEIVEVGGDSTRPGSSCPTVEEEWVRVEPLIAFGVGRCEVWVDTHRGEIARRAVAEGARCINDISGGEDPTLLDVVARSSVRCVLMHSASRRPHEFSSGPARADVVALVKESLSELRSRAISRGISADAIILDTGMGAFLGAEPALSWEIIRAYREFFELGNDMLLGCSRKGFLRSPQEQTVEQRDPGSALVALTVANRVPPSRMLYIRVHDPAIHHEFFRLWENCQ